MAYVPPHRRLLHTTSTSTAPTTSTATLSSPPSSSTFEPLPIAWSPHAVRRFAILDSQPRLLQFQPYERSTFHHLKGCPSYTIKEATAADQDTADSSSERCPPSFALHDNAQDIVSSLVQTLQHDLTSFIARSKTDLDNQIPDISLKFGRILFHPIEGVFYDWKRDYTSDYLEKHFPARSRKTFLDRLYSNAIPTLWEKASREALRIRKKHRYVIKVEDKTRPDIDLLCKCSISGHDAPKSGRTKNAETSQKNSDGLQQLRLRKVRVGGPVRHMVADIACIGKCQDLRFMVCTKDQSLSEEEVSQLEACVSHAVVDKDVKGGLQWPEDGFTSFSNRFELLGCYQATCYSFQQGGVEWKLLKFIRLGKWIMELKPIVLKQFLKGKECNLDDVMLSLNNLLEVAWKYLSSATNYVDPFPFANSSNFIHKFVIAPHAFPGLLGFEPYNEDLYTLHKASVAADRDLSSKSWTVSSFTCDENVAQSLFHILRDDLITSIIERSKAHVNNVVPDIFMTFGHVLFDPSDRDSFDKTQNYTHEYLEKHFQAGTNEVYFAPQSLDAIWEKASRGALRIQKKHRYFIKIEDKSRPDTYYLCKCSIFVHDAPKSNQIKNYEEPSEDNSDGLKQLRLRKVQMDSRAFHMVANIVCIEKSHDLNLTICSKAYLSEEDMSHIEACINLAVVHEDSEGGLTCTWPENGFASFSNRFELLKDYQRTCYSFQEEGVEWKLWKRNSGSTSMKFKPIIVKEFLKGSKEFSLDDVMMSLNNLLKVVWKCLRSDTNYNDDH